MPAEKEDDQNRSLNSIYGHTTGWIQTVSLLLNAGLMVYAHVGLSAVFVSNQQRLDSIAPLSATDPSSMNSSGSAARTNTTADDGFLLTGACNATDYARWITPTDPLGYTGADNKTFESNYCAQSVGCTIDDACLLECVETNFDYSPPCAACFAAVPGCTLRTDFSCALSKCGLDPYSMDCWDCTLPCNEAFAECSGLPIEAITVPWLLENVTAAYLAEQGITLEDDGMQEEEPASTLSTSSSSSALTNTCDLQKEGVDFMEVETYHEVYEVLFFQSMKTAWDNDARLLAVIVVLFSFIWPYTKNIILMFAWYLPMSMQNRSSVLRWLRRLGKYTLVDVYVVLILIAGVLLQLNVSGGTPVIARGEPRPAIIAFLIATLWEFVHIEWMTLYHNRVLRTSEQEESSLSQDSSLVQAVRFNGSNGSARKCSNPAALHGFLLLLLFCTLGLFAVGSTLELVQFTTVKTGEEGGCPRSYNLYTVGLVAISEIVRHNNDAEWAVWTMYVAYASFVIVIPWAVHGVHILGLACGVRSKGLFELADMAWTFASVEVFLIGLFVVEFKFENLVSSFSGDGAELFGVNSELGLGFFVLIAYSVCSGFLHYWFSSAAAELYQVEPHHKVDIVWTMLCGSCLVEAETSSDVDKVVHTSTEPAIGPEASMEDSDEESVSA